MCRGHSGAVTHLDFSANSSFIQSTATDLALLLWDTKGNAIKVPFLLIDSFFNPFLFGPFFSHFSSHFLRAPKFPPPPHLLDPLPYTPAAGPFVPARLSVGDVDVRVRLGGAGHLAGPQRVLGRARLPSVAG